jgi:hypothetical protein
MPPPSNQSEALKWARSQDVDTIILANEFAVVNPAGLDEAYEKVAPMDGVSRSFLLNVLFCRQLQLRAERQAAAEDNVHMGPPPGPPWNDP